jgi:D-alanyl-lipoteichoic acid acyltransferase DltB (MBOAT superfamily)
MIVSIYFNYRAALLIDARRENKDSMFLILLIALAGNLAILFYGKYFNFTLGIVHKFGFPISEKNTRLPIGISFWTFQAISYLIDVYRGTVAVQKKFSHVALYISLFPQLIAGPIVRYKGIAEQIENRKETFGKAAEGVRRFLMGFGKKVILANNLALIADAAFALPDNERSIAYAWLGALAFALQIFFDFSGYSDMAIGLGKIFGFEFPENFNYPYIAKSVSEFWRRWHISLSQWFRDYVYFPLGGSRVKTKTRLVFNLFVVWGLTGLWHGAAFNFLAWGLMFFTLITFEKVSGITQKLNGSLTITLYRIGTLLCLLFGWVLFRANGIHAATRYVLSMFGLADNSFFCENTIAALREYKVFLLAGIILSTPLIKKCSEYMKKGNAPIRVLYNTGMIVCYCFTFFWSLSFLIMDAHNPFLYFNF